MANVLNPEPESITLNTELETPTLEPATELEQPSSESTSNTETAEVAVTDDELATLDADAPTEPVDQTPPVAEVAAAENPQVTASAPPVDEVASPAESVPAPRAAAPVH